MWGDIFAPLGPGEAYSVLGCALFACGFDLAFRPPLDRRTAIGAGALLWVGGFLALGAKENLAVLLLPAAWLGWRNRKSGPRRWVLASCLMTIAFGLFVETAAYLGVQSHGHVYKEDISSEGRLTVLTRSAEALWAAWKSYLLMAGAVLAAALVALRQRPVELRTFAWRSGEYAAATAFLARSLAQELEKAAAEGDPAGRFAPLQPWSAFRGAPCYAIGFAGGGASTGCTYLLGM